MRRICRIMIAAILLPGCASVRKPEAVVVVERPELFSVDARKATVTSDGDEAQENDGLDDSSESKPIHLTGFQTSSELDVKVDESASPTEPLQSAAPGKALDAEPHAVQFDEVVSSVYQSYPLLESALLSRNVAWGQRVGASGAFDMKLKGASENGPQGFYQTYRQNIGVVQPTYWGGEVFAGYRVGRGDFQPWYQERQTNGAGEFKAGVQIPLARNRDIDARRAELWKAGYSQSLAEPDIQAQLIGFVQDASFAYWDWVAAGENHRIAKRILMLAEERTGRIEAQVKAGLVDPPELTDNLRLVSIRQAKVADTRRKMEQTAAKLSVYWRDELGHPIVATEDQLPGFPETEAIEEDLAANIQQALQQRPELRMLDLLRQQVQVDYSEAVNQLQPEVNAVLWGSQDVGDPSSKKGDKSPFESEASVYLDVPIQRRKAHGKMTESQAKIAQLSAKRRITADKIGVDVQMAHAALRSAKEQVERTGEALGYAEDLAVRERQNQEAGTSDLLKVSLREQYAVESAEKHVDALKLYFESRADYRAAMAEDQIDR
jgi:outer membrane protein TolC